MATSKLEIFKTSIVEEKNMKVDAIKFYLDNLPVSDKTFTKEDFQYQKIELDLNIKIDLGQKYTGYDNIGNYVRITQDTNEYYYFIRSANWKSQNTVELELRLDTLNTFNHEFTANTFVLRETKDRFVKDTAGHFPKIIRKDIDEVVEDDIPNTFVKTYDEQVLDNKAETGETDDTLDWYLIYQGSATDETEPVMVSLCPSKSVKYENVKALNVVTADTGGYNIGSTRTTFTSNTGLLIAYEGDNKDAVVKFGDLELNFNLRVDDAVATYGKIKGIILDPTASPKKGGEVSVIFEGMQGDTRLHSGPIVKKARITSDILYLGFAALHAKQHFGPDINDKVYIKNCTKMYWVSNVTSTLRAVEQGSVHNVNELLALGTIDGDHPIDTDPDFDDGTLYGINEIAKTSEKLLKVIALPYCPIEYDVEADNTFRFNDNNWVFINDATAPDNGCLRYAEVYVEEGTTKYRTWSKLPDLYRNVLATVDLSDEVTNNFTTNVGYYDNINNDYESKLFNSNYKYIKLNYDTFNKLIKLEKLKSDNISLDYKVSNQISSEFGFKVNGDIAEEADYDNYLMIARNNEIPIYNSSYLNYIRNGLNYDLKSQALAKQQAITSSIVSAGVSIGTGALLGAAKGSAGGPAGALIGAGIGAVAGGINAAVNISQSEEKGQQQIANKLSQLSNQSVSVASTSNSDLLEWYNDNKVHLIKYELTDNKKSQLADKFRLTGYAVNKYKKPYTGIDNARIWYNYLQCIPAYNANTIKEVRKEFLDDITNRYTNGVTTFHSKIVDGTRTWEFNQDKENYEIWLFGLNN